MREALIFVDTGYLVALLNRRDALHVRAKELAQAWRETSQRLLTTDGVLIELANFFARSPLRSLAIDSIRRIRSTPGWTVERLTPERVRRAESRYASHPDKGWSLTDCLSMEAMRDHRATDVATPDRHFAQAGFRALMTA